MKEANKSLVIIGGGPGGYSAAFRAADLGQKVTIIEKYDTLGGVCLNVGCIPSKSLLHVAEIINESKSAEELGLKFADLKIDINKIKSHKEKIVNTLTKGLQSLAKRRKVEIIKGTASFLSESSILVKQDDGESVINFEKCIISAGSRSSWIPFIPTDDERIWNSTDALNLNNIPENLLIIGGGIIGLEMATVYNALGSKTTVVEMMDQIIPGADKDAVKILEKQMIKSGISILTKNSVESVDPQNKGLNVSFGGKSAVFDNILVSVGRRPNSDSLSLEKANVKINDKGFIETDDTQKTSSQNIYAVGDITGQPMLAHKAAYEGKIAAEVIGGQKSAFMALAIPSVAYTNPEIAWSGITENEAKNKNIKYTVGKFPWAASGRALTQNAAYGFSKILFDDETKRIIGAVIVGPHAGELLTEATLAIEMGSDMEDIARTIHPHPTLSETLGLSAEIANKTIIDL